MVWLLISDSTPSTNATREVCEVEMDTHASKKPMGKEQILREYSDVFKGLGSLPGEYHIEVDQKQTLVMHAPRKIPIAIRDLVRKELEKMEAEVTL